MKRKICVITGSRADYGILKPLLDELKNDNDIILQIIVTGMHLSQEFGLTYKDIKKDGFVISEKIDICLNSDTPVGISKSMAKAMAGIAKAYDKLKPQMILILGDRFEIFSAAAAAVIARIPIAHISGGEVTKGVFDDYFRHSITKMSLLHFTSTEESRKRVMQLGESPNRVFNVGALGLDNLSKIKLLPKDYLEKNLHLRFNKHNLLVTFHPVTLENNTSGQQFRVLLDVLDELKDTNIIFTKANADTYGRIINRMIDGYVAKKRLKAFAFVSMGQVKYLSTMRFVDVIVGNSSSGIVEAPSFKIPTINIGDRQNGRIKAKSVIDCKPTRLEIKRALRIAFSKKFKLIVKEAENPYKKNNVAGNIKKIIKNFLLSDLSSVLKKDFFDLLVKY